MRGLKHNKCCTYYLHCLSHPVWVRGLKLPAQGGQSGGCVVAPCMGAWIETEDAWVIESAYWVAPCMGAWIETSSQNSANKTNLKSHPVWVRGLKQRRLYTFFAMLRRTLYGCVDWNNSALRRLGKASVAPCMGAWIETEVVNTNLQGINGRTLYGCVDWNSYISFFLSW